MGETVEQELRRQLDRANDSRSFWHDRAQKLHAEVARLTEERGDLAGRFEEIHRIAMQGYARSASGLDRRLWSAVTEQIPVVVRMAMTAARAASSEANEDEFGPITDAELGEPDPVPASVHSRVEYALLESVAMVLRKHGELDALGNLRRLYGPAESSEADERHDDTVLEQLLDEVHRLVVDGIGDAGCACRDPDKFGEFDQCPRCAMQAILEVMRGRAGSGEAGKGHA